MVDHALQYFLVGVDTGVWTTGSINEPLAALTPGTGRRSCHAAHLFDKASSAAVVLSTLMG
jgi:hypothetical protein